MSSALAADVAFGDLRAGGGPPQAADHASVRDGKQFHNLLHGNKLGNCCYSPANFFPVILEHLQDCETNLFSWRFLFRTLTLFYSNAGIDLSPMIK
jgi:hypothetical protein